MVEINSESIYAYESLPYEKKKILHQNDSIILSELLSKYECKGPPVLSTKRENNVTASIIPSICGENQYETRADILTKKRYNLWTTDNEAILHGKKYESVTLSLLKNTIIDGCKVIGLYYLDYISHKKYEWLGGTLDAIVELEDGRDFVVEVKCPLKRTIQTNLVPLCYMSQIQAYMYLTELNACLFVQYKPAGPRSLEKLSITMLRSDHGYIPLRLPTLKDFRNEMIIWKYITGPRLIATSNLIKRCWLIKLINSDDKKTSSSDHKCNASTRVAKMSAMFVFFKIMITLCNKRMKLLHMKTDHLSIESKYDIYEQGFINMLNEFKSYMKPIQLCECMLKPLTCIVRRKHKDENRNKAFRMNATNKNDWKDYKHYNQHVSWTSVKDVTKNNTICIVKMKKKT